MIKYRYRIAAAAVISAAALGLTQTADAATAGYPQIQYGTVHSYTTGGNANVSTTDGGYIWCYNGNCNGQGSPLNQTGQVHSYTTGLYAAVVTHDGGYQWDYNG